MLDAVYIDVKKTKSIVVIRPKPPFRPIFRVAVSHEVSDILIINEPLNDSAVFLGGDGGESNSPSKGGCPEYPTGLVGSLISLGWPHPTGSSQASRFLFHRLARLWGGGTPTFRHPLPTRRGGVEVDVLPI